MPAATYGARTGSGPLGVVDWFARHQLSSELLSSALKMTMSYSPTTNCASTRTEPPASLPADAVGVAASEQFAQSFSATGAHGSVSQYSTSRGAPSTSTLSNTSRGSTFTCSF